VAQALAGDLYRKAGQGEQELQAHFPLAMQMQQTDQERSSRNTSELKTEVLNKILFFKRLRPVHHVPWLFIVWRYLGRCVKQTLTQPAHEDSLCRAALYQCKVLGAVGLCCRVFQKVAVLHQLVTARRISREPSEQEPFYSVAFWFGFVFSFFTLYDK